MQTNIEKLPSTIIQSWKTWWINLFKNGTREMPDDTPPYTYDEINKELQIRGEK